MIEDVTGSEVDSVISEPQHPKKYHGWRQQLLSLFSVDVAKSLRSLKSKIYKQDIYIMNLKLFKDVLRKKLQSFFTKNTLYIVFKKSLSIRDARRQLCHIWLWFL